MTVTKNLSRGLSQTTWQAFLKSCLVCRLDKPFCLGAQLRFLCCSRFANSPQSIGLDLQTHASGTFGQVLQLGQSIGLQLWMIGLTSDSGEGLSSRGTATRILPRSSFKVCIIPTPLGFD